MVNRSAANKGALAIPVALLLAGHGEAHDIQDAAPPAIEAPKTNLVIFAGSRSAAQWYGEGAVEISSPLCVGSSTGAYRLSVFPSSGLRVLAQRTKMRISLEQDGAVIASHEFDGAAPVVFNGRTNPAQIECGGGNNARLVLVMPELALMSVEAGQYFDQFRLELEAL